jgi:hypothetical protein
VVLDPVDCGRYSSEPTTQPNLLLLLAFASRRIHSVGLGTAGCRLSSGRLQPAMRPPAAMEIDGRLLRCGQLLAVSPAKSSVLEHGRRRAGSAGGERCRSTRRRVERIEGSCGLSHAPVLAAPLTASPQTQPPPPPRPRASSTRPAPGKPRAPPGQTTEVTARALGQDRRGHRHQRPAWSPSRVGTTASQRGSGLRRASSRVVALASRGRRGPLRGGGGEEAAPSTIEQYKMVWLSLRCVIVTLVPLGLDRRPPES